MKKIILKEIEKKKWLNTEEVGFYVGRSPGAIRNLVMRHKIPFRKVSGRLVFIRMEIEAWMEGQIIEVEKDIKPIKERAFRKYPFEEMDIGDSFFVPLNNVDPIRVQSRIKTSAKRFGNENNRKFITRIIREQNGVRCWRTK